MTFRPTLERARAELQPLVVGRALHLFGGTDLLSAEGVDARPLGAVILRAAVLVKVVTEREAEVLRLLAEGYDTAEVGRKLFYSERTVKNIIHDVTSRLELRNRAHAVAYAIREGLI